MPGEASLSDERLGLFVNSGQEFRLGLFIVICSIPSLLADYVYSKKPLLYVISKVITFCLAFYIAYQLFRIDHRDPSVGFFIAITIADAYSLFLEFRDEKSKHFSDDPNLDSLEIDQ